MRVLQFITKAEIGGAQVHVLELVRGLNSQLSLSICCGDSGYLTGQATALGLDVTVLSTLRHPINPYWDLRAVAELLGVLRAQKPDLVHAHTAKAGIVGRLAGRLAGVPVLYTPHGWSFSERSSWARRAVSLPIEWMMAPLGTGIIAVSAAERDLANKYRIGSPGGTNLVYNGISNRPLRTRTKEPCSLPKVVMVGRFSAPKQQAVLIQALARVCRVVPFLLLFVGDGPDRPVCEALAGSLGVSDFIRFLGDRLDVAAILDDCDLMVLASGSEACPLAPVEGMRAGLPVIASNVGGVPEIVLDGRTGLLVPPGDAVALAEGIQRMLQNPALAAEFGLAGRRRFEQLFTSEAMISGTLGVYRQIVEARLDSKR